MDQPRDQSLLRRAISAELLDLHSGCAGEIVEYRVTGGRPTAKVRLAAKQRITDDDSLTTAYGGLVELDDVEVCLAAGGGYVFAPPLQPGDPVWVAFPEEDPTAWLEGADAPAMPTNFKRHDFAGAVCWPGPRRVSQAFGELPADKLLVGTPNNMRLLFDPNKLTIGTPDGPQVEVDGSLIKMAGGSDFAALASKVDAMGSALKAYTQGVQTWSGTHTHTAPPGGGPTSPPVVPDTTVAPTLESTAAEKVKIT